MSAVALFPGQGVHGPGMDGGLVGEQPDVFREASEALDVDVAELCATGRSRGADLASTRWAQPAIVCVGIASFRARRDAGDDFAFTAGHSLGEYTALVAAGALALADALHLVAVRAQAMDHACARYPGSMAAVTGMSVDDVTALSRAHGVALAAENAPGQLTVSGPTERLDAMRESVASRGGRWTALRVAGAFHSPAMAGAVDELRSALDGVDLRPPRVAFFSSTTGDRIDAADAIREALIEQLTAPVRFAPTVLALRRAGAETFCDLGPGRVLAGLVRRTVPDAHVSAASERRSPARSAT